MTISNKSPLKPTVKPLARLDASLVLARKGEASPAVAATQHNNPGLAWGAPAHPEDFQPHGQPHGQPLAGVRQPSATAHFPTAQAHPPQTHAKQHVHAQASQHVHAQARLRPDSFFAANLHTRTVPDRDPVALTLRVEDETYLRLKYLAQHSGRSTQQVLAEALDVHLTHSGVPRSRKMVVKSE